MLSRLIMALICLSSLQINNINAGKTKPATKASATDVCLYISTLNFASTLPTSAPATPQEQQKIRRNNTEANLVITMSTPKGIYQAQKIAQMEIYIQELKEKKLAEEKHAEWVEYVKASNNCGYFPHSNYSSYSSQGQNSFSYSEKEFPGSHMCW